MELFRNSNVDFMKYRQVWIAFSLVAIALALVALVAPVRANLGIDFAGGTQWVLHFEGPEDGSATGSAVDVLRANAEAAGARNVMVQSLGAPADRQVLLKTSSVGIDPGQFAEAMRRDGRVAFTILSRESVGPQVGEELRHKAMLAVAWSLAGMLAYIGFRFDLPYGVGATMATLHDVLITAGAYLLFGLEWNLTTIAAFLTLIGYSVNDTVVTFDRVRENLRRGRGEPLADVMNRSLNQMLSRTMLTGGTVVLAAGSLLLLGGEVLRGFSFVLFLGVLVGTYSSIYIACPFALLWMQRFRGRGEAAAARVGAKKAA